MKAPVTVDVELLARAFKMSSREGTAALRAGLRDAESNLRGLSYRAAYSQQEPFLEWCYLMGQEVGFALRKQQGFVAGAQIVQPTPRGGWIVSRRNKRSSDV